MKTTTAQSPPAANLGRAGCARCGTDLGAAAGVLCPVCGLIGAPVPAGTRAPLLAVLAFVFINSLGTGIATNGVYFMTKHAYGFGKMANFALAFLGGVMYIAGAIGAGPLLRILGERFGISTRASLTMVMVLLGVLCVVPLAAAPAAGEVPVAWPMWVLVGLYYPLTGILWPVAESYLSGGRKGPGLRTALGQFNITWSLAVVAASWVMGPRIEKNAPELIAALAVLHLLSIGLLWPMGPEPGRHLAEHHEPHPPVYTRLLALFRVLLPMSYLVLNALTPFLPTAMTAMGVAVAWQTPMAATWMSGRVLTFLVLERWHGWHGKWWPAVAGVGLLLGGFVAIVLAPFLGDSLPARVSMIVGLAAFGVGMAGIYTAALYYAMEVQNAEVAAGGTHEALIGIGYAGGPLCGLAAAGIGRRIGLDPREADLVMLGLVSAVAAAGVAFAARRALRDGRVRGDGTRAVVHR